MGFFSGLKRTFGDLLGGIGESIGFDGHENVGTTVGAWLNSFTGQTDSFNRSNKAEWEFWRANNEYNSPKAVMARYEDAGLNPNLIYQGANGATASGTAPSMSATGAGALSTVLGLYNMRAQHRLLNEQIKLTNENAARMRTQNLINGRNANILYYQDKYAEAEYEQFLKTGKIPESYNKTTLSGELVGLVKGVLSKYLLGV